MGGQRSTFRGPMVLDLGGPMVLGANRPYTLTMGIPVKFCTAHGASRPEVGNGFRIDAHGRKGLSPCSCIFGTCLQQNITPTAFLVSKQNFFSLTVCRLNHY